MVYSSLFHICCAPYQANQTEQNKVTWTNESEQAFQALKKTIGEQPVLQNPDFSAEFVVQVDASGVSLKAVLLQEKEGIQHPVAYVSTKFCYKRLNMPTVEKEWWVIKWQESRMYYLYRRSFVLEINQKDLQWLQSMKDHTHNSSISSGTKHCSHLISPFDKKQSIPI